MVEKVDEIPINPNLLVKYTEMGNVLEVQYMSNRNTKQTIQMLKGGDRYVVLDTGEIKDVVHHTSRADCNKSLYKTFAKVRALINTNVTDVSCVRWITLTYAENMTDTKQLYKDFEKFNKRFQYHCEKQNYGKAEYIVMMEPQGRGAWHCHLLYIWNHKAPFIPNKTLAEIWGHGFVKIKKLDNVDNVGAYLTAYLGDMEIQENGCHIQQGDSVKEIEVEEDGQKKTKYFIKGARLSLYPANFNMFRYSKGIKKPTPTFLTQAQAKEKVKDATLTYERKLKVSVQGTEDKQPFNSYIHQAYYNKARKDKQE